MASTQTPQRVKIPRHELTRVQQLFEARALDLEALCEVLATLGAAMAQGAPAGEVLTELLGDLPQPPDTAPGDVDAASKQETRALHDPNALADQLDKTVPTRPLFEPSQSDASPPEEPRDDRDMLTMVESSQILLAQGTVPQLRTRALERSMATPDTALGVFCSARKIVPRITFDRATDAPALDGPGDQRYALGTKLGEGGVGKVILGVDRDLRRSVAIKTLHEATLQDPVQLQAFLEEAIITGGLAHPNIVPVYELSFSDELGPYYTMKRLEGRPLNKLLRGLRARDPKITKAFGLYKLLGCFIEICRGIAYAHDRGVVHCDLKPANVLIGEYGEVVIVDWGLARVLGRRGVGQARALLWSGTPSYMPPEQATGKLSDLDMQTDVWALGAILYEMLTLTPPFTGTTTDETLEQLINEPVKPPQERNPDRDIPGAIARLCMRSLQKDKAQRYPSVHALLRDLEQELEGTRERRRREAHARETLTKIQKRLRRLARAEEVVDDIQSGDAKGRHAELVQARDDLIFGYRDVVELLGAGLRVATDHPELHRQGGDLYWRIFQRLYPARVPPSPPVRSQGLALLSTLSQRTLAAIVQAGRAHHTPTSAGEDNDPWLSIVVQFCQGDEQTTAAADNDALRPLVERLTFLKKVPIFSALASFELLPIAEACEEVRFDADTPIFSEGDQGDALFVILEGSIDITQADAVLTTLHPQDCFGEIAVLDKSTRTAGARSVSATRCLRLTAERFRKVVVDHGAIGLAVIRVLTSRMRTATVREARLRQTLTPPHGSKAPPAQD